MISSYAQRKNHHVPLNIDELKVFKFDELTKSIGEGNVHRLKTI